MKLALALFALSTLAFAQASKPADPPAKPPVHPLSEHAVVQILKAEHDLDQANLTKQQVQAQFLQLQQAYKDADTKAAASEKALNEALEAGKKECGADLTLDPANFQCLPKPKEQKAEAKKP